MKTKCGKTSGILREQKEAATYNNGIIFFGVVIKSPVEVAGTAESAKQARGPNGKEGKRIQRAKNKIGKKKEGD